MLIESICLPSIPHPRASWSRHGYYRANTLYTAVNSSQESAGKRQCLSTNLISGSHEDPHRTLVDSQLKLLNIAGLAINSSDAPLRNCKGMIRLNILLGAYLKFSSSLISAETCINVPNPFDSTSGPCIEAIGWVAWNPGSLDLTPLLSKLPGY